MVTANVIQRTFHISILDKTATCFTIEVAKRQYIITAKHIASLLGTNSSLKIFHENRWENIEISLVGHCDGEIDISVLKTNLQLSPTYELEPTSKGLIYGQDVFFLGFPYGMFGEVGEINRNFPLPFVKKAVVSNIVTNDNKESMLFLDGHNNPGFSGGPVVFRDTNNNNIKVTAVISGYRYTNEPVFDGDHQLPFAFKYNTGIIISYDIRHAVELINKKPIGFEIDA